MANLVQWMEYVADGEPILGVVIGECDSYSTSHIPNYDNQPRGKVISWEEAKKWLDYEFNDGYGTPECNAVYAWTDSQVIAVSQYDGSTSPFSLPRNPTDVKPHMPGG